MSFERRGRHPDDPFGSSLESESSFELDDSAMEDVPGTPTWPIAQTGRFAPAPPVGLNWKSVADALGVDEPILRHDGIIVLAGEYFPAAGYMIDPASLTAQTVDVGDMALGPAYFLSKLTAEEFRVRVRPVDVSRAGGTGVVRPQTGPIIGLFPEVHSAARARRDIVRGSLGSGIVSESGSLGVELRVSRPQLPGRVATVMASHGGAVISIGGVPAAEAGPSGASAGSAEHEHGDASRGGIGVATDSTPQL